MARTPPATRRAESSFTGFGNENSARPIMTSSVKATRRVGFRFLPPALQDAQAFPILASADPAPGVAPAEPPSARRPRTAPEASPPPEEEGEDTPQEHDPQEPEPGPPSGIRQH